MSAGFPLRSPRSAPELPPGRIHVWSLRLDPPPEQVAALERVLARDEIERARRFRFERHQRQYVVGRGVLRTLLGLYLGIPPERVEFAYGPRGKPFLAAGQAERGPQFNLSNSDERALVGLVWGREIGIDLEFRKPMPDCEEIAERFFSESERQVLRTLPGASKEEAFFNCWTRKEAYLKAVGEGLAAPLDSFDVTLRPGDPPRMLTLRGEAEPAGRWFFQHLVPAPEYAGAVTLERDEAEPWEVDAWEYDFEAPEKEAASADAG